jgi:hypothetical protein
MNLDLIIKPDFIVEVRIMKQDVSKKCFNAIDEHAPDYYCFVLVVLSTEDLQVIFNVQLLNTLV